MPTIPPLLLGSYATPAIRIDQRVVCALRGEVEIVGLSAGPIPWPIGRVLPRGRVQTSGHPPCSRDEGPWATPP